MVFILFLERWFGEKVRVGMKGVNKNEVGRSKGDVGRFRGVVLDTGSSQRTPRGVPGGPLRTQGTATGTYSTD